MCTFVLKVLRVGTGNCPLNMHEAEEPSLLPPLMHTKSIEYKE